MRQQADAPDLDARDIGQRFRPADRVGSNRLEDDLELARIPRAGVAARLDDVRHVERVPESVRTLRGSADAEEGDDSREVLVVDLVEVYGVAETRVVVAADLRH